MQTVASKDGTKIAYDKEGNGPAVILVAGAMCSRLGWSGPELSQLLASHFTVYNYDRRGRGDSGDTQPYAVDREIEDMEALIEDAGGSASLWGHSSGGALALEAAVQLADKVKKLSVYEVPYDENPQNKAGWRKYLSQLKELLAANQRGDAVALFMEYVGTPKQQVDGIRQSPVWPSMEALAPTLAYDHIGLLPNDRAIPTELVSKISVPTLVMTGDNTYPPIQDVAQTLNKLIPHSQLQVVAGQGHAVDVKVIAPMLIEFFAES